MEVNLIKPMHKNICKLVLNNYLTIDSLGFLSFDFGN